MLGEATSCNEKTLSLTIYYNIENSKHLPTILAGLKSILDLDVSCHEVALVDNGSSDNTLKILRDFSQKYRNSKTVHLIRIGRNLGFSRANNVAYYALRDEYGPYEYVLLVNNDAIILSEPIKILISILREFDGIGGVQGILINEDGIDSGPMEWDYTSFPSRPLLSWKYEKKLVRYPQVTPFLDGAVSIFKARVLDEVGFFDPLSFMYGDDYVLGAKIWKGGYALLFVPVIVGYHKRSATLSRYSNLFAYWSSYYHSCAAIRYSEGAFRIWNCMGMLWTIAKSLSAYFLEMNGRHLDWARGRMASLIECPELSPKGFPQWPVLIDDNLVSSIIGELTSIVGINEASRRKLDKLLRTLRERLG